MSRDRHIEFELLKKKIVATMQQSFPGIDPSMAEWKGQDIVNFQEELMQKVNAHVSEKWFYTHIKVGSDKLPRIDVLNLLSKYAGYADWNDFIYRNGGLSRESGAGHGNMYFIIIPVLAIVILGSFMLVNKLLSTRQYTFCFYDEDTKEAIANVNGNNSINTNGLIEVSVILEDESPLNYICTPDGCFTMKTDRSVIKMVVNSPYYRDDTITRVLKKFNQQETIGLKPNVYALMLKYFSEMNVQDWQKRREKLEIMFRDDALIYQVMNDKRATGMDLYTKLEFIDKMTMPVNSLKNIEILDTRYIGDKIAVLRFRTSDRNE